MIDLSAYILVGKKAKKVDLLTWGKWHEAGKNIIRKSKLPGAIKVSTIFLGMDHSFGAGQPILFETMIFGGTHNHYQERYRTFEGAIAGHKRAIGLVNNSKRPGILFRKKRHLNRHQKLPYNIQQIIKYG